MRKVIGKIRCTLAKHPLPDVEPDDVIVACPCAKYRVWVGSKERLRAIERLGARS